MCALLPPFRAEDYPGLYKSIILGEYEDIPKKYSKNLKEFIRICLTVDPQIRPSSSFLLEKPYFAEYELSAESISNDL